MNIVAVVAKCLMVDTRLPEALITKKLCRKTEAKRGIIKTVWISNVEKVGGGGLVHPYEQQQQQQQQQQRQQF